METAAAAEIHEKFDTKQRTATDRQIEEEGKKKTCTYVEFIARGKKCTEQSNTHACPHIFFGAVRAPVFHFIISISFDRPPFFIAAAARSKKTLFTPPRVK